jgi:hypothetical protein
MMEEADHERSNFSAIFTVDQTPEEVFAAINNVRGWWTGEIEGNTDKPGADAGVGQSGLARLFH